MKIDRKELVDRAVGIVVVWPFVAALWSALLLAGGQVLYWLKFDVVPNLDLVWVLRRLNLEVPRFSWEGLQKTFDGIASLPLAMTIAICGVAWAALCIGLINAFPNVESKCLTRDAKSPADDGYRS
jgi:hypothetical protein